MNEKPRCDQCRFFQPDKERDREGECRRKAPRAGRAWSTTYIGLWCGEFEPTAATIATAELLEAAVDVLRLTSHKHGSSPTHSHRVPGRWDDDGRLCEECAAWARLEAIVAKAKGE